MEKWRPVRGYEGYYEVSSCGRVLSVRANKILSPRLNAGGYWRVNLSIGGNAKAAVIHRLVAEAFIANPVPSLKTCVNHIDFNRRNNAVDNLEWVSHQENVAHTVKHGRVAFGSRNGRTTHPEKKPKGETNGRAILTADDVLEIRRMCAEGFTNIQIAEHFRIGYAAARNVRLRKSWSHIP